MKRVGEKKIVNWIHPSYRDLVIEELVADPNLQRIFLRGVSLEGIKLALSDACGQNVARKFLLIESQESWEILESRCKELVNEGIKQDIIDLLEVISSAAKQTDKISEREQVLGILKVVCNASTDRWNNTAEILSAGELSTYCRASTLVRPLLPIPDLTSSWLSVLKVFRDHLEACESSKVLDPDFLRKWVDLIKVIADNEPRFLRQVSFPGNYVADIVKLIDLAQGESENSILFDTYDDLKDEATRFSSISELLTNLVQFFPKVTERLEKVAEQLDNGAEGLKEEAQKLAEDDSEDDYDWYRESRQEFDIDALFADL